MKSHICGASAGIEADTVSSGKSEMEIPAQLGRYPVFRTKDVMSVLKSLVFNEPVEKVGTTARELREEILGLEVLSAAVVAGSRRA
jgi:hypothetical protein